MFLLLGAFIAGLLTVLAPCVLPLLPVIIGGSISGDTRDKRRPFLIAGSLTVSLFLFTLLLKVTTLLINVPPSAIAYVSGGIIIAVGLATLFPVTYAKIIARIGLEHRAQSLLGSGYRNHSHIIGPIIIGAALGPVFSSCSPVYGYILATVLPAHFAAALSYIVSYIIGLALILLAISYYGQRLTTRLKFASNPRGYFQRGLAILFILVGVLVITGSGTKLQVYVANHSPFSFDNISSELIPKSSGQPAINNAALYNVTAYQAPELAGIQHWINSQPLTLAQLKGKVVLVDFWTYTCINCIRTLPYVQGWYNEYHHDGLVVIGVEAPEFSYEKLPSNVTAAAKQHGLTYPIAIDGDLATWNAYQNQYWPAEYLIDRGGNVRRVDYGEGEYDQMEQAIRGLLTEGSSVKLPSKLIAPGGVAAPISNEQTPETYFGTERAEAYTGTPRLGSRSDQTYRFASNLDINEWSLSGEWQVSGSGITAGKNAKLRINFAAKNVYMVAGSQQPTSVDVSFNGTPISQTGNAGKDVSDSHVRIQLSNLYRIASFPKFTTGQLTLTVPTGTTLNTFTFGS